MALAAVLAVLLVCVLVLILIFGVVLLGILGLVLVIHNMILRFFSYGPCRMSRIPSFSGFILGFENQAGQEAGDDGNGDAS